MKTLTEFVIPKLWTPKTWFDNCLKSAVSEDSWRSNMVKKAKYC